ncbi:MAG TPA: GDYXXLXY domain-containing protein [Candidatus Omnitrophota bacterium]|nr:GDYXXLXY domain-containing protein [Candidatus Omnitrophota bacterium]
MIPLSIIKERELILKEGEQYMFKTAPIDPYDAFRGRYISLRLKEDRIPLSPAALKLGMNKNIYVQFKKDPDGFAKISQVSTQRPNTDNYVKAVTGYMNRKELMINFPFQRYYMEENKAQRAEKIYHISSSRTKKNEKPAYIIVKVRKGQAVIEGLYVDGVKIEELAKKESNKTTK